MGLAAAIGLDIGAGAEIAGGVGAVAGGAEAAGAGALLGGAEAGALGIGAEAAGELGGEAFLAGGADVGAFSGAEGLAAESTFGGELGAELGGAGGLGGESLSALGGESFGATDLGTLGESGLGEFSNLGENNLTDGNTLSDPFETSQGQYDYLQTQPGTNVEPQGAQTTNPDATTPDATTNKDAVDRVYDPNYTRDPATGPGRGPGTAGAGRGVGGLSSGAFNPGSLLSSIAQMAMGPSRPPAQGQQSAIAQQLADQAGILLNNYNAGQLSAPMMAKLKLDLQGNLNKVRQYYKTAGRYNSTDRIQAENLAYLQATAAMSESLDKELQIGLQTLGVAGTQFGQIANQQLQADNAFRTSLNSALGSVLRLPAGSGAQSGSLNSQSADQMQGTQGPSIADNSGGGDSISFDG